MMTGPDPIASFYDAVSAFYDAMMDRPRRLAGQQTLLGDFARRHGIVTAVDAGCGTGVQTLALGRSGVTTLGVDLSPAMVEQASRLAQADPGAGRVDFVVGSFAGLQRPALARFPGGVDAVFCLGNSLPHVSSLPALRRVLRSFQAALKPGGLLVLQWLNYPLLLGQGFDRGLKPVLAVQRLTATDGSSQELVRYYDKATGALIRFNIMLLTWPAADGPGAYAAGSSASGQAVVHGVLQRPWTREDLEPLLAQAGFDAPQVWQELDGSPFDPRTSPTVTLVARRR